MIGSSGTSASGNGATILVSADAPINLANNALITSATQVGLTWSPGANTGGAAITGYILSYDQGDLI